MSNDPAICGIHLPVITPDIFDDFGDQCWLIRSDNGQSPQWTQDAVDFACMLAHKVPVMRDLMEQSTSRLKRIYELEAENERLRQQLESAQKDAARYRRIRSDEKFAVMMPWLHGHMAFANEALDSHIDAVIDGVISCDTQGHLWNSLGECVMCKRAIDAAIEQQKGQSPGSAPAEPVKCVPGFSCDDQKYCAQHGCIERAALSR